MTRSFAEMAARLEAVKREIATLTLEESSLLSEIAPFLESSYRLHARARSAEVASFVRDHGPVSITEVSSKFGIAYNAAAMALARLVRDKRIVREGAGRYIGAEDGGHR